MSPSELLKRFKTIAVVGLSDRPERISYGVTRYMLEAGYRIIPVNPMISSVFGLTAYPSLKDIPDEVRQEVEVVNIFRKPIDVPIVVDEAIEIGAKAIWLQLGITHQESIEKARRAGLYTVQNRCIMVEHQYL